jgi:uncharacterized protein YicC (UPF0701 family)
VNFYEIDKIRKKIENQGKLHENEIQKLSAGLEKSLESEEKSSSTTVELTKDKEKISELKRKLDKAFTSKEMQQKNILNLKHINSNLTKKIKLLEQTSQKQIKQLVKKYKKEKSNEGKKENKLMLQKLNSIQNLKNKLKKKEKNQENFSKEGIKTTLIMMKTFYKYPILWLNFTLLICYVIFCV